MDSDNNDDDDDDNDEYDSGYDARNIPSSHRDTRREAKLTTSGIGQDIRTNSSRLHRRNSQTDPDAGRAWEPIYTVRHV